MSPRLALCLLLICASFPLMARDMRQMSASGGGGGGSCQHGSAQADDAATPQASKPAAHTARPAPSRVVPSRGSGDAGDVRPPRWHSFLPGMFR